MLNRFVRTAHLAVAVFITIAAVMSTGCSRSNESADRSAAPAVQIPAPADVAAAPPDAAVTATGLASKILKPGHGTRHPRPNSQVTVHYTGWTTDGKMF